MDSLLPPESLRILLAWTGNIAAAATLGGSASLWLGQRTRILRHATLFALSLALLGNGFALDAVASLGGAPAAMADDAGTFAFLADLASLCRIAGVVLNIGASPVFVASLCSASLPRLLTYALRGWTGLAVALSVSYPFLPDGTPVALAVSAQLVVTVAGSVAWTGFRLRGVSFAPLRRALTAFAAGTVCFIGLVILDMAISLVPIRALSALDDLSLPLYLLALSVGLFFFVRDYFSAGPFVEGGSVTPECRARFGLTEREAEIVGRLLDGGPNQEVADSLFISKKTLENHLLNVYRKMGVKSRLQLLQTLQDWKRRV